MKLNQWLAAATLAAAAIPANATTYALWPNATDGQEQIPYEWSHWWNATVAEVSDNGSTVMKVTTTEPGDAASCGWMTPGTADFDYSVLADKDLVFDAKIEGAGTWAIRLTSGGASREMDATVAIPADGDYHSVRFNLADVFGDVNAAWKAGDANGKDVFTFSTVGSNLAEGSAFYFNNVRYVDAVAMPEITAQAADITASSANLTYAVTFPEGYTDTQVTLNGEALSALSGTKALTGLSPKTDYAYTFTATGTYQGKTYIAEKTVAFTTQREAGDVAIWYGVTDMTGFYAEYSIQYNPDGTLTVRAVIETELETPVADRNFHIYIGGDEWLKLYDDGTGTLTGTTVSTFTEGSTITWEWYLPRAGGVYQEANQYVVGSENEKPSAFTIKGSAQNLTTSSAEIAYEVAGAASYKVFYKLGEAEAVEATANPFEITGLEAATEYTVELWATADIDGQPAETSHKTVTFKTLREGARDYVYYDIFETTFTNAFLVGETDADRRDIKVALPWQVTFTAEETGIYAIDLSQVENVVGLVPRIWSGDFKDLTKNPETGMYEYNFGPVTYDAEVAISHYLPYSGGGIDVRTPYTKWGMEKAKPVAAAITVKAEVANVAATSAEINYTVEGADSYKVFYAVGEGEALEAAASPVLLTGLTENTAYTVAVYATAEIEGQTVESDRVTLAFKTTRADARDIVYADILNAEFKNAYLAGETEADRRTIYVALPWQVTYLATEAAVYEIDLSAVEGIVGLVPQIYWNGFKTLTKNEASGRYEYQFGEQTFDTEVAISHYLAYAGGVVDVRSPYTAWGMEKAAPALGEAASLQISANKTHIQSGEEVIIGAVAKDEAGYYLPVDALTYQLTAEGSPVNMDINGNKISFLGDNGEYKLTARIGDLASNEITLSVIAGSISDDKVSGKKAYTDEENVEGDATVALTNVTDGVEGSASQLVWLCGDTEEHYLIFDLEEALHVETVHILFEDARATHFTVTLTNELPSELAAAAAPLAAPSRSLADVDDDKVFTYEDNTDNRIVIPNDELEKTHQYVALRTTAAREPSWGIKVQEMKVYAMDDNGYLTGTAAIEAAGADAPVEYYNLSGMRVANPATGIYIRRQGTNVTKVFVK